MLAREHVLFGVTTGVCVSLTFLPNSLPITLMGAFVGSLLPDIDVTTSVIGKLLLPISAVINAVFGHRGLIHDLAIWIPIGVFLILLSPDFTGLVVGYWSHLFLDGLTIQGVPFGHMFYDKDYSDEGQNTHFLPYKLRCKAKSKKAIVYTILCCLLSVKFYPMLSQFVSVLNEII